MWMLARPHNDEEPEILRQRCQVQRSLDDEYESCKDLDDEDDGQRVLNDDHLTGRT